MSESPPMRPGAKHPPGDGDRLLAAVRRYGWNSTSFQALEPGLQLWFDDPDGAAPEGTDSRAADCVAYFDTGAAWVAAGAPFAATDTIGLVGRRFVAAAARHGRRSCFFATERRFSSDPGFASAVIGEQPVWDPSTWVAQSSQASSLRSQLARARKKGVVIRELTADELLSVRWREPLVRLRQAWLDSRALAPMGFLVQVELFTAPADRRTFVAERQGQLVACLAAVPVHARKGWLFEDILRLPTTPNGTTELLIDAAMRAVAADGSTYVTLGLAPLSGPVPGWLRLLRRSLRGLYDFQGVRDFRAKLKPARWDPIELAFIAPPAGRGGLAPHVATLSALFDGLTAFADGDLVAFGLRTAFRHPRLVTGLLAGGLVPWMAILAAVSWSALFPSSAARMAWLTFDALMGLALLGLAWRFKPGLAKTVRAAALCDAALGTVQLAAMSAAGHPPTSAVLVLLSILTPLAAAALLSGLLPSTEGDERA